MSPSSFSIASTVSPASLAGTLVSNSKTVLGGSGIYWKNYDATKTNRNLKYRVCSVSGGSNTSVENVPFPRDYFELINQAKQAVELALKDEKQLMEIEFPTSGLASVPGDGEGATEMTESMNMIHQFCDRLISPEKARTTRIFFPEANEVKFAKKNVFEGTYFKLDYLTKPSLFEDFGFFERVKMSDRVKPEDELFLVAYPYFNVNEMLVVEELYKEAVVNTDRKLIIFNGELDRIRSGYYPKFFYPKLGALTETLLPKMETVYYIHNFKGQKGGMLPRSMASPEKNKKQVRLCSPARIHAFSQGSCPKHSCLCLSCILPLTHTQTEGEAKMVSGSGICSKRVVVDARHHMLGRLASIVAKELLNGQKVVIVRCEEICLSGGLVRQKMKYMRFLRKRMNTKPSHGPIHFRAPSKIFWRTVRGMIPHKTKRGAAALARMKVFEGVPPPYDKVKRMVIPDALKVLRLQAGHKYCLLGRLSSEVGWNHYDTIKELEAKRKERSQVVYERKKQLNKLRAKAEKVAEEKLGAQLEILAPVKY
ncbi:hypothetical protein HID58_077041 [Brassica napus]|uniref:DUF1995 domain-containing protein n=13 Tax=Brassiceae TaxID=981071 RepID=A0ABQ7YP84_BRANA|nr:hypothetical protein HID58_077041 [Brassica napus]